MNQYRYTIDIGVDPGQVTHVDATVTRASGAHDVQTATDTATAGATEPAPTPTASPNATAAPHIHVTLTLPPGHVTPAPRPRTPTPTVTAAADGATPQANGPAVTEPAREAIVPAEAASPHAIPPAEPATLAGIETQPPTSA